MPRRTVKAERRFSRVWLTGALAVGTLALSAVSGPAPLGAQVAGAGGMDGLAEGPFATLEMVYERTLFNIDVLELQIRVDPQTAARLRELSGGENGKDAPSPGSADALVETILGAGDVAVRTRFRRGVGLEPFLDGMAESLGHASDDGLLTSEEVETILAENRVHFGSLRERGFREDDTISYRLRGDSLEMVLRNGEGEVLLEDSRAGEARRDALLGGYLARGSDFREKLLASLFSS